MIAQPKEPMPALDVWARLSAPVPKGAIQWRQDGRPLTRDGKYFARFVAFIEANTVRARLDDVVAGEWDLTLELLPTLDTADSDGVVHETPYSFKARLQVLGVIREDVGVGKDYKQASTDAFKRAAVRFGIGHELYDYENLWVQLDGDGRNARPVEDPSYAYERKYGRAPGTTEAAQKLNDAGVTRQDQVAGAIAPPPASGQPTAAPAGDIGPACPVCGGRMWDNRSTKRNPRAPDYKCRDRSCDGVVWPPKPGAAGDRGTAPFTGQEREPSPRDFTDEIPF